MGGIQPNCVDEAYNSGNPLFAPSYVWHASATCLRLLVHWVRRAASRAAWTAGSNRAVKMPMIAITTRSSTRVKPLEIRTDGNRMVMKSGVCGE